MSKPPAADDFDEVTPDEDEIEVDQIAAFMAKRPNPYKNVEALRERRARMCGHASRPPHTPLEEDTAFWTKWQKINPYVDPATTFDDV